MSLPPSLEPLLPLLTPLIAELTSALRPVVTFLMICTIFSSILVTVLILLIFFSKAETRARPVFWLNVIAICAGLVLGCLNGYEMIHNILSPLNPIPTSISTVETLFMTFIPLFVESILLLRLLAIFPYRSTPRYLFVAVFAFPISSKIVRLVLTGLFCRDWVAFMNEGQDAFTALSELWGMETKSYIKALWFLELLDNAFVSFMFLWRVRLAAIRSPKSPHTKYNIARRLRALFYMALTTYMFPACLGVAELILVFQPAMSLQCIYVLFVDVYISILGVVFCTLWTSAVNQSEDAAPSKPRSGAANATSHRLVVLNKSNEKIFDDSTLESSEVE